MNPIVKNASVKYGLIFAAISIAYYLIAYVVDNSLFANWTMGILLFVALIVVLILGVREAKKKMGGFISFRDAFSTFVVGWIVNAVIGALFSILLFQVIDPGLAETVKELTMDRTIEMMESFNMSDEQIQEAIAQTEEQMSDQFSTGKQLMGILWNIVFGTIIGLIVAAAMKKDKPLYENTDA